MMLGSVLVPSVVSSLSSKKTANRIVQFLPLTVGSEKYGASITVMQVVQVHTQVRM